MPDFTISEYTTLLRALRESGYSFRTFEEFLTLSGDRVVILRHDVDKHPLRALRISKIEAGRGIKASYHFRIAEGSKNPDVIGEIVSLGHEIAYHYEDLSRAVRIKTLKTDKREILDSAIRTFKANLGYFRQFYPVRIISMHGDPKHSTDNRDLWQQSEYRSEGIICEPYLDIDYSTTLYLTDTGRRWNGSSTNVRDKVRKKYGTTSGEPLSDKYNFRSTKDIIAFLRSGSAPQRLILNIHPQRWTDNPLIWVNELIWQNLKNVIKYFLAAIR